MAGWIKNNRWKIRIGLLLIVIAVALFHLAPKFKNLAVHIEAYTILAGTMQSQGGKFISGASFQYQLKKSDLPETAFAALLYRPTVTFTVIDGGVLGCMRAPYSDSSWRIFRVDNVDLEVAAKVQEALGSNACYGDGAVYILSRAPKI